MTFQDIIYHLEGNCCTIDHVDNEQYLAVNAISFKECYIEDLEYYSVITICHYCFELGIPAPMAYAEHFEAYQGIRNTVGFPNNPEF